MLQHVASILRITGKTLQKSPKFLLFLTDCFQLMQATDSGDREATSPPRRAERVGLLPSSPSIL